MQKIFLNLFDSVPEYCQQNVKCYANFMLIINLFAYCRKASKESKLPDSAISRGYQDMIIIEIFWLLQCMTILSFQS